MGSRGTFEKFPVELEQGVFKLLGYKSAISMSASSKYFKAVLDPQTLIPDAEKSAFVRYAESKFRQHRRGFESGHFGCYHCYKVKPCLDFAAKQTSQKRSKGHKLGTSRFCIECGVAKGIYSPGSEIIKVDGSSYWKCLFCPVPREGRFCHSCGLCEDCMMLDPQKTLSTCSKCGRTKLKTSKRKGLWERPRGYRTQYQIGI